MSTESENLYTKNDQLIAQIYDNLSGENKFVLLVDHSLCIDFRFQYS